MQGWRLRTARAVLAGMLAGAGAAAAAAATVNGAAGSAPAQPAISAAPVLQPCRLPGHPHEALCGRVPRPLDAAAPQGVRIDVHFAVLPALARHKHADPVFVFAGGPGQSAIDLAGTWARLLARVGQRRDVVIVDQRGTGRSAPLRCPELPPATPLAQVLPPAAQARRLQACRLALQRLPHGDLRHYTTTAAMGDVEAVRRALGVPAVNLLGVSYGTRAALEYQRQFPQAVRRLVLDGVAPPDMALPLAMAADSAAALDQVFAACGAATAAASGCGGLDAAAMRAQWTTLLDSLPREATVMHPVTGVAERIEVTRELVLGLARAPLYVPGVGAGLPAALAQAAQGRFEPLVGLAAALQGARSGPIAEGMHFSVICSEDLAEPGAAAAATAAPARSVSSAVPVPPAAPAPAPVAAPAASSAPSASSASAPAAVAAPAGRGSNDVSAPAVPPIADFWNVFADRYRQACADWPRGSVPAAFREVPAAPVPALLLSGGADPATPPRHAARVARALGAKARHVVVAEAGHGVLALPCLRDGLFRFIDAPDEAAAMAVPLDCGASVPRPPAFVPPLPPRGAP